MLWPCLAMNLTYLVWTRPTEPSVVKATSSLTGTMVAALVELYLRSGIGTTCKSC